MPPLQDDNRPHILIIGAGVAGCTLAYELAKKEAQVTLLEAGQLSKQGASAVPVALLNPNRGRTARASELDKSGLEAMHTLSAELSEAGIEHNIEFSGVLRIASNAKQANKWQKLSGARWLKPQEIPPPYHAPFGGIMIDKGGWLEPEKFLKALVKAAKLRGLNLVETCQVTELERVANELVAQTSKGKFRADRVILCIGASQTVSIDLPELERLAGDVIGLKTQTPLPYPIAGAIYGAKKGDTVFIGGNHRPENVQDPEAATRLRDSSGWFVKDLKEAELISQWTGVRAKREDNAPLICELELGIWFYGALGGRGFLCSAYLSRQLAGRLLAH